MKKVVIYLDGKYNRKANVGEWSYYLCYKYTVRKGCGTVSNIGSPTRVLLYALIKGLEAFNTSCDITVISKVPLGFNRIKKSRNSDLLVKAYDGIKLGNHKAQFKVSDDFSLVEHAESREEQAYYDRLASENYMASHMYEYL